MLKAVDLTEIFFFADKMDQNIHTAAVKSLQRVAKILAAEE